MTDPMVFRKVRNNMEVQTSTGIVLGRVRSVHWGADRSGERHSLAQLGMPETEDTEGPVLRSTAGIPDAVLEVQCDSLSSAVFVPHQAVENVSEQCIRLHVDDLAIRASDWASPPAWSQTVERASASPK